MSGEAFSPPEPSRAKFTPSGQVFRLSRPLAWTLYADHSCWLNKQGGRFLHWKENEPQHDKTNKMSVRPEKT